MDIEKIFNDLESNQIHESEESKKKLLEFFSQTKEQWLVHTMLDYFLITGSERIMEVLVKVQTPHDNYIFDRLDDWLKTNQNRVQALNVFCFVVRRHPTWLFKIEKHRFIKSVLKLLTHEKEIVPLMSALLGIITLLPIIPNSVPNFLNELFEVFGHLASWKHQNIKKLQKDKLVHLQLGLQMLFHRLYGMYPCNFLAYLTEFVKKDKGGGIFQHTIKPLLDTVRIHPMLLTSNVETEVLSSRWKEMEPHDVVVECAHLSLPLIHPEVNEYSVPPYSLPSINTVNTTSNFVCMSSSICNSDLSIHFNDMQKNQSQTSRFIADDNNSTAIWSPLSEIASAGSIPLTPTASYLVPMTAGVNSQLLSVTGSSPPEAAVEATPETTPMKDIKETKSIIEPIKLSNPLAVRAIYSQPPSPRRKDRSQSNFPDSNPEEDFARSSDIIPIIATNFPDIEKCHPTKYDRRLQQIIKDRTEIEALSAKTDDFNARIHFSGTLNTDDLKKEFKHRNCGPITATSPTKIIQSFNSKATAYMFDDQVKTVCGECNETDINMCSAGGLHMPTSLKYFEKSITQRHRMVSYCYNESSFEKIAAPLSKVDHLTMENLVFQTGKAVMRRTNSCPLISALIKSDDDNKPLQSEKNTDLANKSLQNFGSRLQKCSKMLAIPAATKEPNQYVDVGIQTLNSVQHQYESSLFELLFEFKEYRNNYARNVLYPQDILDQYITRCIQAKDNYDSGKYQLLYLQLQYERYRRSIHAERNRRLMGRSRDKQSLEMERDRLCDQLKSLDIINKTLLQEKDKAIQQSKWSAHNFNEEVADMKEQYQQELARNKSLLQINEDLQNRLSEELAFRKDVNYELESLRGQIFNLNTELQNAQQQAVMGCQWKQELERLEVEFIAMGEIQMRCRDKLADVNNFRAREEELQMLQESYNMELKDLKHDLEDKISQLDSTKHQIMDLQSQLVNSEKVITEQKRLLRNVKDEYEEMLRLLSKKYEVQKSIILQMEEKIIISLQKPSSAPGHSTCSPDTDKTDVASSMDRNSPLSTSLASSESLSTSLRSSELKNLQQLVETPSKGEAINTIAVNSSGDSRVPSVDLASSANSANSIIAKECIDVSKNLSSHNVEQSLEKEDYQHQE